MRLGWLAVMVAVAACEAESFDPRWQLGDPRILAVRAEPPVIAADGEVALDALAVDSAGDRIDAPVRWRACDPWQFVLDPALDCPLPIDGTLRAGEVLAAFGGDAAPLPPVQLDPCGDVPELGLPVVAELQLDGLRLVAIKRVPVAIAAGAEQRRNPELGALLLDGAAAGAFVPGRSYRLGATVRRDSLDEVCEGGAPALEAVRVHLYTTAGELGDAVIDLAYELDGSAAEELTTWRAPATGPATFWLVAIDPDGGVDWRRVELAAEAR